MLVAETPTMQAGSMELFSRDSCTHLQRVRHASLVSNTCEPGYSGSTLGKPFLLDHAYFVAVGIEDQRSATAGPGVHYENVGLRWHGLFSPAGLLMTFRSLMRVRLLALWVTG